MADLPDDVIRDARRYRQLRECVYEGSDGLLHCQGCKTPPGVEDMRLDDLRRALDDGLDEEVEA